jgi:FkbM family methyltransferase
MPLLPSHSETTPRGRRLIARVGKQIDFYKRHPLARRMKLLQSFGVSLVLDVGANTGQYALALRRAGYQGRIVSFEPVARAHALLSRKANRDPKWSAVKLALGNASRRAVINVSGDSRSSSLLEMLPAHQKIAPYFGRSHREEIEVRTLDSVLREHARPRDVIFLKLDTQGYERQVLDGGRASLRRISGLQVEMSLVALYQGAVLLPAMLSYLGSRGFELMSLEDGFCDPATGRMLQMDGVFFRP